MARTRTLKTILYCAIAWAACALLPASEHHGVVRFSGLPVPGATIVASQGEKKLSAVTDQQGVYTFPDLPDGTWTLQVEMLCFTTLKQEVAVAPNAPSPEWELKMMPFDEIKAAAPVPAPSAPAATSTPTATATAAAPTNAPTPSLTASIAAANKKGSKKGSAPAASAKPGFQRADLNASSAPPPPDAAAPGIDEASPGAADALMVNGSVSNGIERRAIGNTRKGPGFGYRGDLSAIVGNSALDAHNFSLTGQNTGAAYNHLRFGGSLGGPIAIPHLFRTQNGNFFIGYQSMRNRNASVVPTTMPTVAERAGDFSQAVNALGQPVTVIDPTTGAPFPGNIIPVSRISSQAQALINFYPLPNFTPTARYNYQVPLIAVANSDAMQARVNKVLNPKNSLNGTFAFQRTSGRNPNLFSFVDNNGTLGMRANVSWRHTFTKSVYGTFGLEYSRSSARTTPFFADRPNGNVSGLAGITGNNQDPGNYGPPTLSFNTGIATLSDAQQSFTRAQTSAVSYNILWLKRPHNMTIGGDYRRIQNNVLAQQDPRGSFYFSGAATQLTANGAIVPGTGSDFADFLLGVPDTSSIAYGNADKYYRSGMYDAYFTDDWRVSAGFTLNWGARWEYGSPITEQYGRLVNLDIARGFAATAPVLGNSTTGALTGQHYPDSLVKPDRAGIQPRIGISWRPIFGSSLLVRGGYGVNFNTSVYQSIAAQMAQQSPFSKSLSVANSILNPLTLANGFNAEPGVNPNTFAIDPNFRVGYVQTWQVSAQQDLPYAMVATATYLGVKGTRAVQVFLPNTYPTGAPNPCPSCLPGYIFMTSNGNSTRESGSMQLRRRLHNGVTATALYTYSKSFDDAALGGGGGGGGSVIAQNWLDLSAERGPSRFDQRHVFTLQTQYSTGVGVRGGTLLHGWRGTIVKGWTVTTNLTAGTGLPESPIFGATVAGTGVTGPIRPDVTGLSLTATPPGRFLNPAAYTAPASGHWGDAGRNSITGPAQFQLGASMARTFEEKLDLRFDSTNVLNHVTYQSWITSISSSQFGLPSAANGMRTVQATLRWRF
jgi:hypothetical protein